MSLDGNSKTGKAKVYGTKKEMELQQKLDKAIEALKFYADRKNWQDLNDRTSPNNATSIIEDRDDYGVDKWNDEYYFGGKLARQTLKELKGE